jgi:hypothetical protein
MVFRKAGLASPRGRWATITVITAIALGSLAAAALAASPKKNAAFSGSAKEYMNNAPHWQTYKGLTEKYHFKTSKNGKHLLNFSGHYVYYCGAGASNITDQSIAIKANGSFNSQGATVEHGGDGKVTGTAYVRVWGKFTGKTKANVSYLFDFVYAGHHVSHPYSSQFHSATNACEGWIHGTAKAG